MELQDEVKAIVRNYNLSSDLNTRLLDLISETGELAKELLTSTDYGRKGFVKPENWIAEIGDIMFSLCVIANQTNIDLEEALKTSLNKYEKRFEMKGDISSNFAPVIPKINVLKEDRQNSFWI
ncbi:MAG: hypothetical protein K9I71_04440 [Ignavibacteriales bacterium]|nr:hypothetical protein [Ignavibacteriales bacterium]MCF8315346.1 hypothetical protein [Ignavibacteriales bacterium]MCF8436762.1 hypothetical protein [Ignavibacteriales bacterium]